MHAITHHIATALPHLDLSLAYADYTHATPEQLCAITRSFLQQSASHIENLLIGHPLPTPFPPLGRLDPAMLHTNN